MSAEFLESAMGSVYLALRHIREYPNMNASDPPDVRVMPMYDDNGAFREGTDALGRMRDLSVKASVASVNLGYSIELGLKLLVYLQEGKNAPLKGRQGHNLQMLYDLVSAGTRQEIEQQWDVEDVTDLFIQELIDKNPEQLRNKPRESIAAGVGGFEGYLLDNKNLLLDSRYKYADQIGGVVNTHLPYGALNGWGRVLWYCIGPKAGVRDVVFTSFQGPNARPRT